MARKKPKVKVKERKNGANLEINQDKLDTTLKKQWVLKSIELLKQGYSPSYIRDYIRERKQGSKSESALDTIISEANILIVSDQFLKAQEIIPIHIMRYNQIVDRLMQVEDGEDKRAKGEEVDSETYWKLREKKIRAFNDAINTLYQKEDIKQYHNKDFTINLNIEEEVVVREVKPQWKVDKLSFEDQLELLELMKLSKKDENELLAIIHSTEMEKVKTEDVEAVVVEKANVEDIQQEQLPAPKVKSPISSADPTIKLRESLQKLAAKQFKEVGGSLTEEEEKLIK
jgi:hypothetical protein